MVTTTKSKGKVTPVYEKLDPGSCYILSKTEKDLLVACNIDGKVEVKRVPIPKESTSE
jgi:hypothetical protein